MSATKPEFVVVKCGTHGYAAAATSEEEGVAFELVQWGLPKVKALAMADDLNARAEHVQRID